MISVIVATAREDRPWAGQPEWHTCDPVLRTLARQEGAPEFEVILTDALGALRGELPWGDEAPAVLQYLDGENDWHRLGRSGLGAQANEAARHARGDILVLLTEGCMAPPWLLRRIAEEHDAGRWPNLLFLFDYAFSPPPDMSGRPGLLALGAATDHGLPAYDLLGHAGRTVALEHRWGALDNADSVPCAWEHFFGYFTLPRRVYLGVGGYDVSMDGDRQLADVDIGSRIALGPSTPFTLTRDCFVVEAIPRRAEWNDRIARTTAQVKCNYALLLWNRFVHRRDVARPLSRTTLPDIERVVCGAPDGRQGLCPVRDTCREKNEFYPLRTRAPERAALREAWERSLGG